MTTISAGVVLYSRHRTILLVEHTEEAKLPTGSHGFPAGRVEKGETPEETAVRELEEETGLKASIDWLIALPEERKTLLMKNRQYEEFIFKPYLCTAYFGELKRSGKTIPREIGLDSLDRILLVNSDVIEISRKHYTAPSRRLII